MRIIVLKKSYTKYCGDAMSQTFLLKFKTDHIFVSAAWNGVMLVMSKSRSTKIY